MSDNDKRDPKEVLNELYEKLQSSDDATVFSALSELKSVSYSSEAIRKQLEQIAIQSKNASISAEALALLGLAPNRAVQQRFNSNKLDRGVRYMILQEIADWVKNNLIENHNADVLRRRYDFDIAEATPQAAPVPAAAQQAASTPKVEAPAPVAAPRPQVPPEPRPSLLQTLTSEASIKVYLYLGAFFVIAAAAILGAAVPELRLPILIIGTLIFGGLAVAIKKRLPQPSFTLFVVFSFLLLITANVIEESMRASLNLTQTFTSVYWAVAFLIMAAVWSGGTWLYESRFFSITAFGALILSTNRIGDTLDAEPVLYTVLLGATGLIGLGGTWLLKKWRDEKFAQPLFIAAQLLQVINLASSFIVFGINIFNVPANPLWNLGHFVTWGLGTTFFLLSNGLYPFFVFPWLAAATLIPMPWFVNSAFNLENLGSSIVLFIWGAMFTIASEVFTRFERLKKYSLPVLLASMPGLALAVVYGFLHETWLGLVLALGVAVLLTALHILKNRAWLWTLALLSAIIAYFAFFQLDFIQRLDIFMGYQVAGISILLLLPDLILKKDWSHSPQWRLPLRIFGALFTVYLSFILLAQDKSGHVAICYALLTVFFAIYALAYRNALIGYLPTAYLPLTLIYALNAFNVDAWLPVLTVLAVIYYFVRVVLRNHETWGGVFRNSSLALGALISFTALLLTKETGGWYVLIIGLLFIAEMFLSKNGWFEIGAPVLFTLGTYLILRDFNVTQTVHHLLAYSLVWILADLFAHLTFTNPRPLSFIVRAIGGMLAFVNYIYLFTEGNPVIAAIGFGIYALLFLTVSLLYRQPKLLYIFTLTLPFALIYTLDAFNVDAWLPVLTVLAVIYYFVRVILRNNETWSNVFRNSSLALGALISFTALLLTKETGGWYALIIGLLFIAEMYLSKSGWFEIGAPMLFTLGIYLILRDFNLTQTVYHLLAYSLVWILADLLAHLTFINPRPLSAFVRVIGGMLAFVNYIYLFTESNPAIAAIGFGIYALLFLTVSLLYRQPNLFYAFTLTLPLFVTFLFRVVNVTQWIHPVIVVAMIYYAAGTFLAYINRAKGWDETLRYSGLGVGVIVSFAAPILGGLDASIPVALAATLWAFEAFSKRNAWLAFPANILYVLAYFIILFELNVDEPQFFSIGIALFGLIQHYLLTRAEGKSGTFLMGMFSQFVLLGTTYIEMINKNDLGYFFLLFVQSLVILVYGLVIRSRSLTFFPIGFVVLGVVTVVYSALKDIGTIFVIGCTGILLLLLGVGAVLLRERIAKLGEKLSDWQA